LRRSPLHVFEALAEELRISAVQTDIVLRGRPRFEADNAAYDKCDGFSLGLADTLRRAAGRRDLVRIFECDALLGDELRKPLTVFAGIAVHAPDFRQRLAVRLADVLYRDLRDFTSR